MSVNHWNRLNRDLIACERCPRLRSHCREIGRVRRRAFAHEEYWAQPVPNFGDPRARLLIVGLAPAAHGANRTGRMFTGDRSGDWLFRALHKAGFASQPDATHGNDGLMLTDCAITAACHCAPPDNKPTRDELERCSIWLQQTVKLLPVKVFLALGQIGWRAVVDFAREADMYSGRVPKFSHGACAELSDNHWLVGSYHPSQQNTFTGRLTEMMFDKVFAQVRRLLDDT